MAYSSRPASMLPPGVPGPPALRQPSSSQASAQQQSSALSTRIAAKKAELDNLRQLRDLSGTLAMQMQALETKVSTLKDGTEGSSNPNQNPYRVWLTWPSRRLRTRQLGECPAGHQYCLSYVLSPPYTSDLQPDSCLIHTEKASGLHEHAESEAEAPKADDRLPATLVRIPAEPSERTGE
ncbi:hypothetical protein N7474_010197 [Penicillium riverlandense]|uniref:uncharacterized protein n=1 Tax=Penicillium riverlandense TaxID=1903569 RepID=UPI00254759B8|nr:uncharacterized protein N7474_010197 [Penicillium riverlandense]KAJ5808928.1 hypothetical protein N7474_010197 [Penicillium riverlandense]